MPKLFLNASKKTKHTPAGQIPVDWGWGKLETVATIQTGLSKSSNRTGASISMPYLRVANVQDGFFTLEEIKQIDVPADQVERFSVKSGDLLLTEGGDFDKLGRGAVWRGQIEQCVHQNHLFVVRGNPTLIEQSFLASYTQSPNGRSYFQSCAKQSTNLASINSTQLKQLPVPLPPLPEQRRIADILSTWDRAIETLESLIAAKERRKQALMEQLLSGRKRLPGFKGKWSKVKLSELLTPIIRATAKPSSPFLAAGIRCHGRGVFLKPDFKPADIMLDELYEIQTNDLVVNITFAWEGAIAIVPEEANGALVSHRFPTYLFKQDLTCSEFFRHVIKTHGFVFECGLASPGGAGRNRVLSKKNFLKIAIPCPELREQRAIAAVLDTADRELTLHRQHLATLRTQKRGLMGKLLTGVIRTPNK